MDKKGGALGLFGYSFSKREKKKLLLVIGEKKNLCMFSTIYSSTLDQGKCKLITSARLYGYFKFASTFNTPFFLTAEKDSKLQPGKMLGSPPPKKHNFP
jgi:hypothetical protein